MSNEQTTAVATRDLQSTQMLPVRTIDDLKTLGQIISSSGMFGTQNPAEGIVVAAMCHQDGVSYSKWTQTNHMIKGKVSKRADAIQADFLRSGGKIKVLNRTPEEVSIEVTDKHGGKNIFALTWEDALKEPFVYQGLESDVATALAEGKVKNLKLKVKYTTPRSRMQMLWARLISDSIRVIDPTCCQGVYTPEEVGDFADEPVPVANVNERVTAQAGQGDDSEEQKSVKVPPKRRPGVKSKAKEEAGVIEAEAEVIETDAEPEQKQESKAKQKQDIEPTPFDDEEEEPDYNVCPIDGRLKGVRWDTLPKGHLEFALKTYGTKLDKGYTDAIKAAYKTAK